jgi:hypothetical protein
MTYRLYHIFLLCVVGLFLHSCGGTDTGNAGPQNLEPDACALDVFVCPGDVTVGRDPEDNCNFYPCP